MLAHQTQETTFSAVIVDYLSRVYDLSQGNVFRTRLVGDFGRLFFEGFMKQFYSDQETVDRLIAESKTDDLKNILRENHKLQLKVDEIFKSKDFQVFLLPEITKIQLTLSIEQIRYIKIDIAERIFKPIKESAEWINFLKQKLVFTFAADDSEGELLLNKIAGAILFKLNSSAFEGLLSFFFANSSEAEKEIERTRLKNKYSFLTKILNTEGNPQEVLAKVKNNYVCSQITDPLKSISRLIASSTTSQNITSHLVSLSQIDLDNLKFKALGEEGKQLLCEGLLQFLRDIAELKKDKAIFKESYHAVLTYLQKLCHEKEITEALFTSTQEGLEKINGEFAKSKPSLLRRISFSLSHSKKISSANDVKALEDFESIMTGLAKLNNRNG